MSVGNDRAPTTTSGTELMHQLTAIQVSCSDGGSRRQCLQST